MRSAREQRLDGLPGADLVSTGIGDLRAGRETVAAALVSMAESRLRGAGIDMPPGRGVEAAHLLYGLLESDIDPHSRYNALVARVVSFARAAERAAAG